jgi:nitrate/TMAO reductase-like tetraheme cytochrome c subunit
MIKSVLCLFKRREGPALLAALICVLALAFAPPVLAQTEAKAKTDDPHAELFLEENFPSANQCSVCHQKIYKEWASSNHAYASISPMFHKFEQKIYDLTQGTIGSFCVRCHQTVGTQREEPREAPLWERSQVAREGVTCITCHRVADEFGKTNGERNIIAGDINSPVYNSKTGSVFDQVIKRKAELKMATNKTERGAQVHEKVVKFSQISKSEFCSSCHQVAVNLGIKLEVVWEQYRDSPAAKKGVTCQACHMGKVPGVDSGYEKAPVAIVAGEKINPNRKHHNHAFYGPGYPIAHPGIFPHNTEATNWTIRDWLKFDWRVGWGKEGFEEKIEAYSEVFEAIDEASEELGVSVVANSFASLDSTLGTLKYRLADHDRRSLPLKEALGALENLSEALDAEDDEESKEKITAQLVELNDAIEEDKGNRAANAIKGIEASLKTFNGIWKGDDVTDQVAALHEKIEATLKKLGSTKDEDEAEDLFENVTAGVENLRKFAAPGIALHSQIWGLKVVLKINFPKIWRDIDDREEAREIIEVNLKELEAKRDLRQQVMNNGSQLDGPYFDAAPEVGSPLSLSYKVTNVNTGHNLPSGSLGAQPEIWMNVALIDPDGKNVWESGYVDSNGDFADIHSLDLAAGKIKYDDQLFNLQTKFLTTNVKGTDREMYLPVNFDLDQRPFLRPPGQPTTVMNHPPFVRMEGRSIPPLGDRKANYKIPSEAFKKPGKYRLAVRLRSRAEPIYFMKFVGATDQMIQSMNQWMVDIHPYTVEFDVK